MKMTSDAYIIAVNTNKPGNDPNTEYEVMRVLKKDTEETVASIFYCKNAYKAHGYHFSASFLDENDFYIVFDDLYLDMVKTKQAAFEAMLMHEVGHLINGDLNSGTRDTEIREERLVNLLNGKVDPKELAADRFAVEHCGKNAVIQMLDHVMMTRKKRHTADEVIALKELELRKKAVVRL